MVPAGLAYVMGRAGSGVDEVRVEFDTGDPVVVKPAAGGFVVVFPTNRTATAVLPVVRGRPGHRCDLERFWSKDEC